MNPHDHIADMRHRNPALSHAQQQAARRLLVELAMLTTAFIVGLVIGLALGSW